MDELSPDLVRLINGLAFFIMGLVVVSRATAYPTSSFRNRLFALGAFGLFHAAALSVIFVSGFDDATRFYFQDLIHVPSHMALYYFAFGWNERRPTMVHAIVLALICGSVFARFLITEPTVMQIVVRLGVAMPASICAALVLMRDSSFRFGSRFSEGMRWTVIIGFMTYAMLNLFSTPADFFPASVFNTANFEAVTGMPIRLARAGAVLVIAVGILALLNRFDVVMRQQMENTLAISEAKLKRVMDISKLGSWNWNIATGDVEWSDQTYRIFGSKPQKKGSAAYPAFLERVHADDRVAVEKERKRALEQHTPYRINHRILTQDGAVRIVRMHGEVEVGPDGTAHRMLGTVLDVTELEEAKMAVRDRDASLSRILEVSPEAIIVADQDARIVLFSEGAQSIFGYSSDEILGRSIEMLMPDRLRAAHQGHVRAFAAAPESSRRMGDRSEIIGLRKNGEEFPAEATISKLKTADGLTYTVSLRDMTDAKALREELLAAKVAAESSNEAKSNFIANMSHELRTPLNAILGFSEIIEKEIYGPHVDPRYRDYAADVHRSGQHLLSVINDILSISRLEAGKTELKEEGAIDIEAMLGECARWVEGQASEAGIELRTTIASGIPALRGDPRLLTQIVLNLLSNAMKFTRRGGSVDLCAGETEAGGIDISVRDTGVGMTADQLARIGDPFLQFDNSQQRKFDGTGLGLSIAKRLVELHGGGLEFQSTPGVGTTISIILPPERSVRQTATGAPKPIAALA